MRDLLKIFYVNFKMHPEVYFFYGFLLTFTLSIRKVLYYYPLSGSFNEYTGIYLYLSDIFVLAIIFTSIYKYLQKNSYQYIFIKLKNCSTWNFFNRHNAIFTIFFLFIAWSWLSLIWSQIPQIAIFRSIKLIEVFIVFAFILNKIVPHRTYLLNSFIIIIIVGTFQSIFAICQFILQKSLGLTWLWESMIAPNIPGVAKIIVNGDKYIRSYGLMPHPNILGGFLLVSIILTITIICISRKPQIIDKCSLWNTLNKFIVPRGTQLILLILLVFQIIAQFLTFSKSAILGTIIGIAYLIVVSRETFGVLFKITKYGFFVFLIILLLAINLKFDIGLWLNQSLQERIVYLNISRETITNNVLTGSGIGQFVPNMSKHHNLAEWQFQPVHNVFLLVWSELCLIGLILFTFIIWMIIYKPKITNVSRETNRINGYLTIKNMLNSLIIGLIFIMLFDHYFWDIHQGILILWTVAGYSYGFNSLLKK